MAIAFGPVAGVCEHVAHVQLGVEARAGGALREYEALTIIRGRGGGGLAAQQRGLSLLLGSLARLPLHVEGAEAAIDDEQH